MGSEIFKNRNLILEHLMDQADIGYIEINMDFSITLWSRGAGTLLGHTAQEALGKRLDKIMAVDKKALTDNEGTGDIRIFHMDRHNTPLQYQVHYNSIIGTRGEKAGTALLVKEIIDTRDECYQSSLRAGTNSMEDILGFAPVGIFHAALDGNLTMANSEYAWMLGYESTDYLVQAVNDFAGQVFYDEKHAEDFMFLLMEAERVARFRCRLKRKNGSFIWALCFAMLTFDASGRADGFNGYAIDIGETVKAETALQKANEELMRLSVIDGLTQIANRRQFDAHLNMEWKGHINTKKPLSVILCDIDYFKIYNDTYGHQAGDECLKKVAGAIDDCARLAGGLAARYGGEEFGIILPGTSKTAAAEVAENIRAGVLALGIAHNGSRANANVTLSLGIATTIPRKEASDMGLLADADAALYLAKEQGRNRWVSG
ncbi:MAG: diguanylate cyclase [Desulfobacter sp.]|nr:MAG: diguanylate cyclase [Desulfobacter sp.]